MNGVRRTTKLLAVFIALAFLSGCAAENEDLKAWMQEKAKDMKGRVTPSPGLMPIPQAAFIGTGPERQPFDPGRVGDVRR